MIQREIIGNATRRYSRTWTYRFNQPNPTTVQVFGEGVVAHTADNYFLFEGTNSGYVLDTSHDYCRLTFE